MRAPSTASYVSDHERRGIPPKSGGSRFAVRSKWADSVSNSGQIQMSVVTVILHGPVGVGKTMLAQSLGQLACRRGHTVVFTKTSRLLADLALSLIHISEPTRL